MKRIIAALLLVILLLTGCSNGSAAESLTDNVTADGAELPACTDFSPAAGFSAELFRTCLLAGDENPVISPVSAYICLAMVMRGAETDTLAEFETVMGAGKDDVTALCNTLIAKLTETEGSTMLNIANSLWADSENAEILDSYIQSIVDYYGADIFSADLSTQQAINAVNEWVNEKTEGLIPTLHDEPYPDNIVLVLLNTLYMKAKWQDEFEDYATYDDVFTKTDGTELTVPFMDAYMSSRDYFTLDGAAGVVLPYDDGKTVFVAVKPAEGQTAAELANSLDANSLNMMISAAESTMVNLTLPRFNISYELYLTEALQAMGLETVFTDAADLTSMGTGANGPLALSWVFQKVKIKVNEEGTEAAAVTEAAACESCIELEQEPVELHFDSPFVYAVVDTDTGLPLFMGILDDPSAE